MLQGNTGATRAARADGKGSILFTNHAFVTGITNPEQFTILDVFVADTGSPLELPVIF